MIRLFISSVQKEFADIRKILKRYVTKNPAYRRLFDAFVFEEDVVAMDRRPDEVYLDELRRCDVYIGLIGNEYGFEDENGLSPTEREFDEATRLAMPRLLFVRGRAENRHHPKESAFLGKVFVCGAGACRSGTLGSGGAPFEKRGKMPHLRKSGHAFPPFRRCGLQPRSAGGPPVLASEVLGKARGPRQESRQGSQQESMTLADRVGAVWAGDAKSRSTISKALGQKKISGQLNCVLADLPDSGRIVRTIPGKPNSRLQKYGVAS